MKPTTPNVVIMAGGTGGHIFPGLAVADRFAHHGVNVRWLGAQGGMECRQVAEHGIEVDQVKIAGVRGKGLLGWVVLPFRLAKAVFDANASMSKTRPNCALSFGGYAAGPGGIAAWLRGIPLVVHEQNQVPGMTNRALAKIAKRVLQAFPDTFPAGSNAVTCGNPVRESVTGLPAPELRFSQRNGRPRLLITGGSQGASALNTIVPEALLLLPEAERPLVCHQTGNSDFVKTKEAYANAGIEAEVHRFIEDIAQAYCWADLVVCRAGALTVSELAAAGIGAILVPYPNAVDDHQTRNAAFLVDSGAAQLIPQDDLSAPCLVKLLGSLFSDRPVMLEMAKAARSVAVDDAAEQVYDHCKLWVKQK